ncbi:MAG TPA: hypothetical protein VHM31_00720 [Polyangia bacterium]|nr:hypothetical protein [Polyangia bacterium]HVY36416.1 hypothetical protein [Polyangia bacterium]
MRRPLALGLVAMAAAAGCGGSTPARPDAGGGGFDSDAAIEDAGPAPLGPPPMTGLAVVNSDYSTTSLSILDAAGALVRADCVDSATRSSGSATKTISGDAALPSQPQLGGNVVVIDRGNVALTFVDPAACTIVRQILVPGVRTNPHDVVMLAAHKAYVTRYDRNLAATDPRLAGNDIAVIDPTTGALRGRIDLDAHASAVPGATILARPDRALLVDGRVIVSLNEIDQGFRTYGEGKLVVVDPATDTVTAAVALTGLANCEGMTYVDAEKTLLVACGGPFGNPGSTSGIAVVDLGAWPPVLSRVIPSSAFDGRPVGMGWVVALPPAAGGARAFAVTNDPNDVQPDALFAFDYLAGTAARVATSAPYTLGVAVGLPGLLLVPNATTSRPRIDFYDASGAPTPATTLTSDPVTGLPPQQIAAY